jgi:hypothetical protein
MDPIRDFTAIGWYPDPDKKDGHPGYFCCHCGPDLFGDGVPHEGPCVHINLDWRWIHIVTEAMQAGARLAMHQNKTSTHT